MARGHKIIGLDIGTSKIKLVVAQKTEGVEQLEILDVATYPSFGMRKGVVINPEEISKSIIETINKIKESADYKIESCYVNLGGSHVFAIPSRGVVAVSRADRIISEEDIKRVLEIAENISLPNKRILDTIPVQFIIDSEGGIKNALGMSGVRLEVEALLLGGLVPYIDNLTNSVLGSDLEINNLFISSLATARSCLTPRQKEIGVAVLDIGAETTGFAVFQEGDLKLLSIFPIGSNHITNDIAIGLKCEVEIAERIKQEYGIASSQWVQKKDIVDISSTLGSPLVFSRKKLAEIIEARISDIFDLVKKEFKKMPKELLLPGGIVLTGGGSNLPKIIDLAKKELKLPCHSGLPQGFAKPIEDPSLATVCGLVLLGSDFEESGNSGKKKPRTSSWLRGVFRTFIP